MLVNTADTVYYMSVIPSANEWMIWSEDDDVRCPIHLVLFSSIRKWQTNCLHINASLASPQSPFKSLKHTVSE